MSLESLPRSAEANHFNLIRLVAASAVIVSHSYSLAKGGAGDPLQRLSGFDLGTTAVLAFFAISGFFISLSFDRQRSELNFILARITRIIPGLLVCSLITAFIVGPLFTSLATAEYFGSGSVWLYPVQVTSVIRVMAARLPEVFANNPHPYEVNTSLWTLFYEVACYTGLFVVGLVGLLQPRRFAGFLLLSIPLYLFCRYGPWTKLNQFAIFGLPFLLGMTVYQYRSSGILKGWIALALAVLAAAAAFVGIRVEELWSLAVGYGVLWLGFAPASALLAYNRAGDYSYGTYIYGFVVQQIVVALLPQITPIPLMLLSLPLAILCGALSWYFIERPAIGLRKPTRNRTRLRASSS